LRYGASVGTRNTLALLLVTACQASPMGHTGFGSSPDATTAPAASTGEGSTSSVSSGTSTGEASGSAGASAGTTAEPVRDLGGMPDFGDDSPIGCKGKIDFLFVISRQALMEYRQAQLTAAFPQFIDTIKSKFADFDYHIMVVAGDDGWGNEMCTDLCPTVDCKVGEPCCEWSDPKDAGQPCCEGAPDYPCEHLDEKTVCDDAFGAGTVFPAGAYSSNKLCPISVQRRYMVTGEPNLEDTFACVARVGVAGHGRLGQALTAAVQKGINDPGGCNPGFLRKDALLMVTLISTGGDQGGGGLNSKGTPEEWGQAVMDAKQGVAESIVVLNIGFNDPECDPMDGPVHADQDVPVSPPRVCSRYGLRACVRRGGEHRRDRVRRVCGARLTETSDREFPHQRGYEPMHAKAG
jgi:hypothetical protein